MTNPSDRTAEPTAPEQDTENLCHLEAADRPDSEGLGFWGDQRFTVGFVDEVNGPGSCNCPDYVPTKYEVLQLAASWWDQALDTRAFMLVTGQVGSSDWRIAEYAERRVDRIASILGDETVNKAVAGVERKWQRRLGDRAWEALQSGTEEDRIRIAEENMEAIEAGEPGTPAYALEHLKKTAVKSFPDMPDGQLAQALRLAAAAVEEGDIEVERCDHHWEFDSSEGPWWRGPRESICAFERCGKCGAMRDRNVYPGDPDFDEAVNASKEQSTKLTERSLGQ
jgi:hypothetical protein